MEGFDMKVVDKVERVNCVVTVFEDSGKRYLAVKVYNLAHFGKEVAGFNSQVGIFRANKVDEPKGKMLASYTGMDLQGEECARLFCA
jgi:hypothetical protein